MKKACLIAICALPAGDASASAAGRAQLLPSMLRHPAQAETMSLSQGPAAPEAEAKLPPVPAPADTGADGFPQLPAVTSMLKDADETMKSIDAQASSLAKRVAQAQQEKAAKMAKQKAIFDEKLRAQEAGNRAMIATNGKVSEEITALKTGNGAIVTHAKELQAANKLMRSELSALGARLGAADKFVAQALLATDDSRAKELAVLRPAPKAVKTVRPKGARKKMRSAFTEVSKRHDDADDADEDDAPEQAPAKPQPEHAGASDEASEEDGDEEEVSLLALASRTADADEDGAAPAKAAKPQPAPEDEPKDMLNLLKAGVEALQKQENQGEASLKKLFVKDFQAGAKRHAALLAHQRALNATRASLTTMQGRLRTAEARLEATKSQLEERLHGLGVFMQKLAHLALAPAAEVPNLMKATPAVVDFGAPKAAVVAPAAQK